MNASAIRIVSRRFQRSTYAPANGPRSTVGTMIPIVAVARTCADPVSRVSHQTSANPPARLPTHESC